MDELEKQLCSQKMKDSSIILQSNKYIGEQQVGTGNRTQIISLNMRNMML